MEDSENNLQPSKKRAAGVQLSRDNPGLDDNEETSDQEMGTFKKASEEVLATRRIVKVRRSQTLLVPPASSAAANPFAAIRLVPPSSSAPPEVGASSVQSKEIKEIDETESENKVNEPPKGESTAEEKASAADDNTKQSEDKTNEPPKGESTAGERTGAADDNTKQSEAKTNEPSEGESTAEEKTGAADDNTKQSEDKTNEPSEGESTAEEKTGAADDNIKKSENKADDFKSQQKGNSDDVSNQDSDISAVEEVAEGGTCADPSETQATKDVKDEGDDKGRENGEVTGENMAEIAPFTSFRQLSSNQNAFSGLSGTGFSSTSFSFGLIPKDRSPRGTTFSFGNSNNGNLSIFGSSGANAASKSENSKPPMSEVPVETGEENEKAVFTADSALFEFIGGWKERGKGELKVNVSTTGTGKARLVMRARGNYRLILNASLFPDMKLTNMDKKGITFACVNSAGEGKDGLSTFALKFKDASIVEDFRAAVMEHKSAGSIPLKTPEKSPMADER